MEEKIIYKYTSERRISIGGINVNENKISSLSNYVINNALKNKVIKKYKSKTD